MEQGSINIVSHRDTVLSWRGLSLGGLTSQNGEGQSFSIELWGDPTWGTVGSNGILNCRKRVTN